MKKNGAIVLDFDGTIANAESVMMEIYKPLAEQYNWPKLTRKDYFRLKKSSPREIMRWAEVKIWQLPKLLRLGREEYKKHASSVKLFKGMPELIGGLAEKNDVYILSSNDRQTVTKILSNNGFKPTVKILHGSPIFGKSKVLKKLLKNKYDPKKSWMIGDEIRDIEAGKRAGMNTIGVLWGLQSRAGLKKASPSYIAKNPQDIAKFIYNIKK